MSNLVKAGWQIIRSFHPDNSEIRSPYVVVPFFEKGMTTDLVI
jgi:hypothetical protein